MKLATAGEMAAIDRLAAERFGVPTRELMEQAGRRVAEAALSMMGPPAGRPVAVFCGRGNNGGDGCVAARVLREAGAAPAIWLLGEASGLKDDSREGLERARGAGVVVRPLADAAAREAAERASRGAALVIDALFGTGFEPPARGPAAEVIALINRCGVPVLAVDLPSGLSADHGRIEGEAVAAAATVTFGLPKPGQVLHPAASRCGRLYLADIGFPPGIEAHLPAPIPRHLLLREDARGLLRPRAPDTHKGTYGHVLIVAGSRGVAGAALLCARGALRAGAGLATLALPASLDAAAVAALPEAMTFPLPDAGGGAHGPGALEAVLGALDGKRALAVGPGISRAPEAARIVLGLLPRATLPMVIDADGINALAGAPHALRRRAGETVLTPHPGELGRLLGLAPAEVAARRLEIAAACARDLGVTLVLKGARTVVAAPTGEAFVNATGNPGMAAGGMGDVLTGMIAAFLAQGHAPLAASLLGVHLHGLAGDLLAAARGPWGLLAGELADRVPEAARTLAGAGTDEPPPSPHLRLLLA